MEGYFQKDVERYRTNVGDFHPLLLLPMILHLVQLFDDSRFKRGWFMRHGGQRFFPEALFKDFSAPSLPDIIYAPVEQVRVPNCFKIFDGMVFLKIIPAGADFVDQIDDHRLPADFDSLHELIDHAEDFIDQDHIGRRYQRPVIQPTAAVMYQARPHGRRDRPNSHLYLGG